MPFGLVGLGVRIAIGLYFTVGRCWIKAKDRLRDCVRRYRLGGCLRGVDGFRSLSLAHLPRVWRSRRKSQEGRGLSGSGGPSHWPPAGVRFVERATETSPWLSSTIPDAAKRDRIIEEASAGPVSGLYIDSIDVALVIEQSAAAFRLCAVMR